MLSRWNSGSMLVPALAGSVLVSLSLSGCGKEGDTVIIYADGGTAGTDGQAGNTGVGGSSSGGAGGDEGQSGGTSAAGGDDAAGGSNGGAAGGTSTGGNAAGGNAAGGNAAGGSEAGSAGNGAAGTGGTSYEGALFVEDFEDGNYEGWQLGPGTGTYEVTTDQAANGSTRSLAITGGNGYYDGPNIPLDALKPSKVSWWVRAAGSVGNDFEGFFSLSANPDFVDEILNGRLGLFGVEVIGDDALRDQDAAQPDHWYHFEVEMDWEAETFTATVDGLALGETAFATSGLNGIWRIDLFNANGIADNVVYYDEIVMMP